VVLVYSTVYQSKVKLKAKQRQIQTEIRRQRNKQNIAKRARQQKTEIREKFAINFPRLRFLSPPPLDAHKLFVYVEQKKAFCNKQNRNPERRKPVNMEVQKRPDQSLISSIIRDSRCGVSVARDYSRSLEIAITLTHLRPLLGWLY